MRRKTECGMRLTTLVLSLVILGVLTLACGDELPSKEALDPETATTLGLNYDLSNVAIGDEVEVVVLVEDVEHLYGVALDIVYNPAVYKYASASTANFLSRDGENNNFAAALEDGIEGRLVMGISRIGTVEGLAGSGPVMTARFEVLCNDCGDGEFKLDKTFLKNPSLVDIPVLSLAGDETK